MRNRAPEPVLNVGAGGEIGAIVARGNCVSIDVDPNRDPDVVTDICALFMHFPAESFASVFMIEVLEHVERPAEALHQVWEVLQPGGTVVISVPYIFEIHDAPNDYWRFTEFGLRKLLSNFSQVKIERRNGYFRAAITPLLRLSQSPYRTDRAIGALFLFLSIPLYPFIWAADKCIRSTFATTGYHITATKPAA
jgi:SAM-dependent methyltransferase